jgi:hypothetical protein
MIGHIMRKTWLIVDSNYIEEQKKKEKTKEKKKEK